MTISTSYLADTVARASGLPFQTVHLFARRLKDAGYLPKSSSGKNPEPTTPEHAANLIAALSLTDTARNAPKALDNNPGVVYAFQSEIASGPLGDDKSVERSSNTAFCVTCTVSANMFEAVASLYGISVSSARAA